MAGTGSNSFKQLLLLIREYASEKTQGERRVFGLRKRIEELQSELEVANAELENVKRTKETTEQELKGREVELSLIEAAIQTLEARISVLQGEIASVGSELEGLKSEEGSSRDQFIDHMSDLNQRIRKFQDKLSKTGASVRNVIDESSALEGDVAEVSSQSIEERIFSLIDQINKEEEDYGAEQNRQNKVRKELFDLEKKLAAVETMIKETKELQDLTRETSALEEAIAHLSEELQNSCLCPKCRQDNMESLDNIP